MLPLDALRAKIGAVYDDTSFHEIITTSKGDLLWRPTDGTTCAISVTWAFAQCGAPESEVNRVKNYRPGGWDGAIAAYARKFSAYWETHNPQNLQSGDIFLVADPKGELPWHMGIVEMNMFPSQLVTIDGGQSDMQGRQMINRVIRPYDGELIGGPPMKRNGVFVANKRRLMWRIDSAKVFAEKGEAPPKVPAPGPSPSPNVPSTPAPGQSSGSTGLVVVATLGALGAGYLILQRKKKGGKKGKGP